MVRLLTPVEHLQAAITAEAASRGDEEGGRAVCKLIADIDADMATTLCVLSTALDIARLVVLEE